jgi:hypothetical protein
MYQIAETPEQLQDVSTQTDPYALLFRSMKERQSYSLYAEKFAEFYIDIVKGILTLTRAYCDESEIIPMVGKREQINIAEYKSTDDISYKIEIAEAAEDLESQMGKQLTLQHYLQYVGSNLDPQDAGKILRAMPYLNDEELFSDLTLDYDNAKNDMLALDRGEQVQADQNDNHSYMIKKLTNRMKQADFRFLNPQIQQNYAQKRAQHEQFFAQQQQAVQAAQAGYIPSGGSLVGVDLHKDVPGKPGLTRRVKLPGEAINWLISKLESQGSSVDQMSQIDPASIQAMINSGQLGQPPQQQIPMQQNQGMGFGGGFPQ